MSTETAEYYEAQVRSKIDSKWSRWMRLGGKTLDGAHDAISLALKSRGITAAFVDTGDDETQYRIRHFIGSVETI